jgi:hypothetical protein
MIDRAFHKTMSTSISALDKLLGGGLEVSLMHLFYGFTLLRDDLLENEISKEER